MNDSADYPSLIEKNVTQLRAYLQDAWPISDERLFARRNYEKLLKNLNRRARATGCEPDMIEPEFPTLLKTFVQQNVDAEAYLRKAENVRHYERGRADMEAAYKFGAAPASFRQFPSATPLPWPPVEVHAVGVAGFLRFENTDQYKPSAPPDSPPCSAAPSASQNIRGKASVRRRRSMRRTS